MLHIKSIKICTISKSTLQNLSLHGVLLKNLRKKKEYIIIVIAHQGKHILHTYTFKSGGSLVIPSWQPALYSRHIHITHYRADYNVSKAAS